MDTLLSLCILGIVFGVSAGTEFPSLAATAVYDGNHREGPLLYYDGINTFNAEVNFSITNTLPKSAKLTLTCRMKMTYFNHADNFKHNEVFVQKYLFDVLPNEALEKTQKCSFSAHISEKGGFVGHMQCSAHLSFVDNSGRLQGKTLVLRNVPRVYAYSVSVDGAWTEWSSERTCTVSCGEKTVFKTRTCTNPAPVGNGAHCPGDGYDGCSTEDCIAPPSVITKEVLKLLAVQLPGKKFKRLYRSSEDGASGFHDKCDSIEPLSTVTIGQDNSTGFYYGGYTTKAWKLGSTTRKSDPDAFIFKITCAQTGTCEHLEKFTPSSNSLVIDSSMDLPVFSDQLNFNSGNKCIRGTYFISTGNEDMDCSGEWKLIEAYSVI